jgi:hypothetical protein
LENELVIKIKRRLCPLELMPVYGFSYNMINMLESADKRDRDRRVEESIIA